jgi:hypothetical protein
MPTSTNNQNDEQSDFGTKKLEVFKTIFLGFCKIWFVIYRQQFVIQQFKWVVGQLQMIIY